MHLRIHLILFSSFLLGYTHAQETSSTFWSRDDIYIDDDGNLEGSGGGQREVKDDLESSGSGFGPDDEDGYSGSGGVVEPIPKVKPPVVEPPNKIEEAPVESNPPSQPGGGDDSGHMVSPTEDENGDNKSEGNDVYIMNTKTEERATSFFAQPGILAAVIGGAVVGLLCAILVVMFIVYRMRKKDEGSYALDEPKRSPTVNSYTKNSNREFFA